MNIFRVRNKTEKYIQSSGQPNSKVAMLQKRAGMLAKIRQFFQLQGVMEVDVPILSSATVPDLHLDSIQTQLDLPNIGNDLAYYLHTSPEYTMKRLLCEGSGDIYYLGKVFRQGDLSPRHQPEFTMLEWYRLDYSLQQMMAETAQVVQLFLPHLEVEYLSYQEAFKQYAGIENIHQASAKQCKSKLDDLGFEIVGVDEKDKNLWEQLVLTELIEPKLGLNKSGLSNITCLYQYPAKDAALAQLSQDGKTAERFEIFVNKMEIANGYLELQKADAYQSRFLESLAIRKQQNKDLPPIDQNLLQALKEQNLPECSGVALGFDRLFMLVEEVKSIEEVLSFSIQEN